MSATRSFLLVCAASLLLPAAAAAQPPTPRSQQAHAAPMAWAASYQETRNGPESTEAWSRSFRVGTAGSLDLSTLAGDVEVIGAAGEDIRVEAVKRVRGKDADAARAQLADITIEVNESPGRVEIATIFPRKHNMRGEVDVN